ncbi:hypothetical protein MTO96_049804 [Rhipicephalus appendiculatus]
MKLGQKSSSFEELESAIAHYERTIYAEFWISKSRTIDAARKKGIARPIVDSLSYYSLTYSCKHGGRPHQSKSTGARPKQTRSIQAGVRCECFPDEGIREGFVPTQEKQEAIAPRCCCG